MCRSGAINWNDSDDNNAFHSKQIVMDLDGTISTEVAIIKNKEAYNDIVTMGLPLSNDGKPVPSQASNGTALIPQGAKNVEAAKDFLKYFIQPKVNDEYLKVGLARSIPAMPSIVKTDPWWLDPKDPHRVAYVDQGLLGPTVPNFWVFNPAWAEVQNQHVWGAAWADIIANGMTPQRRRPTRRSSGPRRFLPNTRSRRADRAARRTAFAGPYASCCGLCRDRTRWLNRRRGRVSGEIVGPSKKFRPQRVFGANRKEHRHDHQSDQAFIAA